MKKLKIVKLLETFSKEEIKRFEKFINSPYFNNGRNYLPLWKFLKSSYPEFNEKDLTEEKIFKKVYPGKEFNDKSSVTLRVLISHLTSLAKKFIAIEGFENEPFHKLISRSMRHGLMQKGLNELARLEGFENLNLMKEHKLNFSLYETLLYTNIHISSSYQFDDNQMAGFKYNVNLPLYNISFLLSLFSMIINNCINSEKRYNIKLPGLKTIKKIMDSFDDEVLDKEFEEDEFRTKKFISFYYHLCKSMLDVNDEVSLSRTIDTYKEIIHLLGEPAHIFIRIHNMLRERAYNLDYEKYGRMDNDLSGFVIDNNFYIDPHNKYFRTVAFDSILEFKISFLDADRLKIFIDKSLDLIRGELKEDMKNYSHAWLYFKKRDFEKVLESVSKLRIADISFKDNVYKLKITALVDLGFYEEAILNIDSYEHYLNNNKSVSEDTTASGKRFTNSMRFLIKSLIHSGNGLDADSILKKTKNSVFGEWFKEKMNS